MEKRPESEVEDELAQFNASLDQLRERFPKLAAVVLVGSMTDAKRDPFRARPRAWGNIEAVEMLWQRALPTLLNVLRKEAEAAQRAPGVPH